MIKTKNIFNIFFISLFLLFGAILQLSAQETGITGTVTDKKTGETLPAVQIYIPGTTTGTVTDFDGKYKLNVSPGSYTLKFRFISYNTKEISNIEVKADKFTTLNTSLSESVLKLEEVSVVAKKIEDSENALVTMKRKAAVVTSGISSQEIAKAGASNAASALKKVTGVSVQGGKYVYVRGLSDRYSKTILNGADIPGLDPERNTVQMDIFPTVIIDNMLVYKTFSPDLPGDFTGGLINIKTKNFPDKLSFGFSAQIGFNPQSNLNKNFLSYSGGKFDFIGFDDGTRALPDEAKGDIPARYEDNPKLNNITRSFNKTWMPKTTLSGLNQKYTMGFGNNKILNNDRSLGYFLGGSYSYSIKSFDNGEYGRYKLTDKNADRLNDELVSQKWDLGANYNLWSIIGGLGYRYKNNSTLGLTVINNHSGLKTANFSHFIDYGDNEDLRQRRTLEFTQRNLLSFQINGTNPLHENKDIKMNWIVSYSQSSQDEPDIRYLINDMTEKNGQMVYYINKSVYSFPRRYYRNMNEHNFFAKVNFEHSFTLNGNESKVKYGFANSYRKREYRQTQMIFAENHMNRYTDIANYFSDSNIDAVNGVYVQTSEKDDQKNSYNGTSNLFAGYLMTDLRLNDKLRAVIGFRVENICMETISLKNIAENKENAGSLKEFNLLPSINLTYSPNKMMNLRIAYNRTLARPSFREKSSMAMENRVGDIIVGNDSLKQTTIDNLDFRWEKYFNPGELFSLGAFYKRFKDPIEQTFNTEAINPEITWRNVEKATMYGAETELMKKLDFIGALRNLKISGNVTYVFSRVSIDKKELESKRYFDPDYPDTRSMFEQSPWILNAILSYSTKSGTWNANLSYTFNSGKLVIINPIGIPDVYSDTLNDLNLNIEKKFGTNYRLRFQVKNILEDETNWTYSYKSINYTYLHMSYGREYSLKFTYSF